MERVTMPSKVMPLDEAVRAHVRAGDAVHVMTGHTRWTAAARELARQWWGRTDARFTLVMLSLSSLGTLFFRGGMLAKVVTGYSGDVFPNFTPNRIFGSAYRSGAVAVEHWSFLAYLQRLEAAARGLPAIVTRSLRGSSMETNEGFCVVDTPFGPVGLLAPLAPDVALVHAAVADRDGNVAFNGPLLEGVWGALAARRGAVVTVERVVDDIRPWAHLVRLPAHRTLAVCETPMGAHPGGFYALGGDLPVDGYGEDYEFWSDVRAASRTDEFDEWIRHWVLEPSSHEEYLARLGRSRIDDLRAKADPDSWRAEQAAHPVDRTTPPNAWEVAAVHGARYLAGRILAHDADAALAGAGVANLATWLGVEQAREAGSRCVLTAELGLWGYEPRPADPFVFNHRNFPTALMTTDSSTVLGMLVGGPGTTTLACLGAAQIDRFGNINSTEIPGGPFLVGSGGGNDVASVCREAVVVATLTTRRTTEQVPYVTSPGDRVRAFCTDLGVFEKRDDGPGGAPGGALGGAPGGGAGAGAGAGAGFVLTAVAAGPEPVEERIERIRARTGWNLTVARDVGELTAPTDDEVARLRSWDVHGWFLRDG
jgi:acyl CoA:acetate/3-ketoacid CoA transferase alpha subunit/acyl CoA:acetate/3-ketoacid CoA transferase beta subunit